MIELDKHIEHLLLKSDCVIVPSLGGFVASHVGAWYDSNDNMFIPPYRTLGFNPKLNINDSLLAQSYTETYDISYPEACNRIEREVEELRQHIENHGSYELNDIGTLYLNDDGNIEFTPCEAGILTPDLYSLSSFEMKTLEQTYNEANKYKNPGSSDAKPELDATFNKGAKIIEVERITKEDKNRQLRISAIRNLVAAVVAVFLFFVLGTPVNEQSNVITSNMDNVLIQQLLQEGYENVKHAGATNTAAKKPVVEAKAKVAPKTPAQPVATSVKPEKNNKVVEQPQQEDYFCLVLASRVTKVNANAFVSELKQNGYTEANVLEESNKSIKVTYGHYMTQQDAFNALNELRGKEYFYDAWVFQVKN